MKNLANEKPTDPLAGRKLFSINFIEDKDLVNKVVLDIGCGFGWFELFAASKNVKKIVGLELAEDDLETAKKNINNISIEFQVGNATNLPFDNNYFDTVVSWEVIEHIPKGTEKEMLSEIRRVLKKGGAIYISTPNNSMFSNILDPA